MVVIYAAYKDIIDVILGVLAILAMLVGLVVAGIFGYMVVTGRTPGDDTVYVCTLDGDTMRCAKEEQ